MTRAPASWPSCGKVWRVGGHIPGHYRGCSRGGRAVAADVWGCSFGQRMTTYGNRYYGVLGNVVNDAGGPLQHSKKYQHAYALCTG